MMFPLSPINLERSTNCEENLVKQTYNNGKQWPSMKGSLVLHYVHQFDYIDSTIKILFSIIHTNFRSNCKNFYMHKQIDKLFNKDVTQPTKASDSIMRNFQITQCLSPYEIRSWLTMSSSKTFPKDPTVGIIQTRNNL